MSETNKIARSWKNLDNGQTWMEVNFRDTLDPLSFRKAAAKPLPHSHNIWEIVNHLRHWRQIMLQRLAGESPEIPDNNFFYRIPEITESAWQHSLSEFYSAGEKFLQFIESRKAADLKKTEPVSGLPVSEAILGVLQHDAYHLGQIKMLIRLTS
jgi:uncharacterized damage-inducible protein DinB